MSVYEEPPIVDLDELLDEQEAHATHGTRTQWTLVVVGGIVGITGILTLLVVTTPVALDVVRWIDSIQKAVAP
ncbi:MAG: hypothetical protein ABI566_05125 [Pseudolysinimonas sp.]